MYWVRVLGGAVYLSGAILCGVNLLLTWRGRPASLDIVHENRKSQNIGVAHRNLHGRRERDDQGVGLTDAPPTRRSNAVCALCYAICKRDGGDGFGSSRPDEGRWSLRGAAGKGNC